MPLKKASGNKQTKVGFKFKFTELKKMTQLGLNFNFLSLFSASAELQTASKREQVSFFQLRVHFETHLTWSRELTL